MNEWTVVTVITGLVGLFAALMKPLMKLNSTLTRLDESVTALKTEIETYINRHGESHRRLWTKINEQSEDINQLKLSVHLRDSK